MLKHKLYICKYLPILADNRYHLTSIGSWCLFVNKADTLSPLFTKDKTDTARPCPCCCCPVKLKKSASPIVREGALFIAI